jgi:ElaB/YqjD/DUF883 family membrane-anchored ribosome-binding protein
MNTNRNVSFGSGVGPSGAEVQPAVFQPEVMPAEPVSRRTQVKRRLEDFKSRSLSRAHEVQRAVTDRTSLIKSNVRSGVDHRMMRVQTSMRTSPAKWAGIAAGSGFVLGLFGRLLQSRSERHRHVPQLVVIETSC